MRRGNTSISRGKVFLKGVLLALFLVICVGIVFGWDICKQFRINQGVNKVEDDIIVDDIENLEYSLSMVMVGDYLVHDKIYWEALEYGNGDSYDFSPMLSLVGPIVSGYDIAYYNQETILGGSEIGLSGYPAFNSPYEVGDAMIESGFNLVSLATNHTLDRGEKAIINSRNYWDSKDDVLAVGSYVSFDSRDEIRVVENNNITYTMLNYTYGTNGVIIPYGKDYLVNLWPVSGSEPSSDSNYQNYKNQVKKDINAVREMVDVLIVAMHWGVEYEVSPNDYQVDMAKYLADLGVDIVIGTHPHVIQPIEWIDDTLVIYSLGNFISAHEVIDIGNRVGLMSSVNITKVLDSDGNSTITINNLSNELLYTYYTDNYDDILVVPFSLMEDKYLNGYEEVYEKYKGIVSSLDNNISVVPLR